jgi:hypothetical protein
MKRLLLTIICLFAMTVIFAQRHGQETLTLRYDLTSGSATDTILPLSYEFANRSYQWRVDVMWDSLTGTLDGVLKIKTCSLPVTYRTDTAYLDYPLMSSVTMNSATGYCSFEDYELLGQKLALYIDVNNITAGVVRAWVTLKPIN